MHAAAYSRFHGHRQGVTQAGRPTPSTARPQAGAEAACGAPPLAEKVGTASMSAAAMPWDAERNHQKWHRTTETAETGRTTRKS